MVRITPTQLITSNPYASSTPNAMARSLDNTASLNEIRFGKKGKKGDKEKPEASTEQPAPQESGGGCCLGGLWNGFIGIFGFGGGSSSAGSGEGDAHTHSVSPDRFEFVKEEKQNDFVTELETLKGKVEKGEGKYKAKENVTKKVVEKLEALFHDAGSPIDKATIKFRKFVVKKLEKAEAESKDKLVKFYTKVLDQIDEKVLKKGGVKLLDEANIAFNGRIMIPVAYEYNTSAPDDHGKVIEVLKNGLKLKGDKGKVITKQQVKVSLYGSDPSTLALKDLKASKPQKYEYESALVENTHRLLYGRDWTDPGKINHINGTMERRTELLTDATTTKDQLKNEEALIKAVLEGLKEKKDNIKVAGTSSKQPINDYRIIDPKLGKDGVKQEIAYLESYIELLKAVRKNK